MNTFDFDYRKYLEKYTSQQIRFEDLLEYARHESIHVPVLESDGQLGERSAVYLDNAASLPILRPANYYAILLEEKYRSNVGRSYGYRERVMRLACGQARIEALKFFGAPPSHTAVLGSNISVLLLDLIKHIIAYDAKSHFIISPLAHSAMSIPVHHFAKDSWSLLRLDDQLNYDLNDLSKIIGKAKDLGAKPSIAIETISNITGYETNWRQAIDLAKANDARVILDNAQGACFVEIDLSSLGGEVYVGVSGHKMGARDGSGVLVGPVGVFQRPEPLEPSSGMIFHYSEDAEYYMPAPATLERGTPNYVAQASLAEAMRLLRCVGLSNIRRGINQLSSYLEEKLSLIPRVKLLEGKRDRGMRFGPVSFVAYTAEGQEIASMAIAACLSYFHGIQVRANHHCAPILLQQLKGIPNDTANLIARTAMKTLGQEFDVSDFPATAHMDTPCDPLSALHVVRPSVSFSNTRQDIDRFVEALDCVLRDNQHKRLEVKFNRAFGLNEFIPTGVDRGILKKILVPNVDFGSIC